MAVQHATQTLLTNLVSQGHPELDCPPTDVRLWRLPGGGRYAFLVERAGFLAYEQE